MLLRPVKFFSDQKGRLIKVFVFGLIFSILLSILNLVMPAVLGKSVDILLSKESTSTVIRVLAVLFIIQFFTIIGNYSYTLWLYKENIHLYRILSMKVFGKILMLNYSNFGSIPLNEYVTRMYNDTQNIANLFPQEILAFLKDLFFIIGASYILIARVPLLGVILLISLPLIYITIKGGLLIEKASSNFRVLQSNTTGKTLDPLYHFMPLKSYSVEDRALHFYGDSMRELNVGKYTYMKTVQFFSSLGNFISGIMLLGAMVVLVFTYKGITAGEIVMVLSILSFWNSSSQNIASFFIKLRSLNPSIDKVSEILNAEEENLEEGEEPSGYGIEFKDVFFSYNSREVLKGISFYIREGEKVAIVGRSGEGKSTIVKLLLGLYSGYRGEIEFGGLEVKDIKKRRLRQLITYVPQEPFIYPGTIRDNFLIIGEFSDGKVIEALEKAKLKDYILSLPQGLDTPVYSTNIFLSGGERQKFSIARAFLREEAKVIVLDETSSQMDSVTEEEVYEAIEKLSKSKTLIVIAHRISTIARMERIFVLEDGTVKDEGTHVDLSHRSELYRRLCELQMVGG
ncbi:MAG TPA: ABC transporter ATP-binding protein [Candidatus Hydrothermia bacterium]|nr:ABC transporter ATP-binding protein [Candidatus Hydrothermia bacterium]